MLSYPRVPGCPQQFLFSRQATSLTLASGPAKLEHFDSFSVPSTPPGEFDYRYNTLNQPVGTFAVGTTADLGQKIALNPVNSLSFDFSIFVVPEPSTWAMMLLGFAGLGFVGYRRTPRAKPKAA